ncbi:MAG: porin family protein [Cyclobacteriaceae bacterium]|nr:porin family protein [Cyclobacteriaceae bacterium]
MTKKLFFIALLLCTAGALKAQKYTGITYSIGFPSGDLTDFIDKTSFRGINIDYKNLIQPNIGIGFSVGWNVFYTDMDEATYTVDNISIWGKQYRYANYIPLFINANYYLKPDESLNPFVGLGIGTMYSLRNTDMNLYTYKRDAWNFALQPEVGLLFDTENGMALNVSARYTYGFQAGSELTEAQSYFSINLGFVFMK